MATTTKNDSVYGIDTTPLFAVVGVTDLAVERVRAAVAGAAAVQAQFEARVAAAQAGVEKQINEFDPQVLRAQAQDVPNKAAAFVLTRASQTSTRAEATYEELARRGKSLVERIRSQQATQDLVNQAGTTVSRGKAAVTVARRAADDTTSAILGTLNVGKREATAVVDDVVQGGTERAEEAARATQAEAKKTATTTRKRAATTRSAAKGAQTSATKTATKAAGATKAAAKKVGN